MAAKETVDSKKVSSPNASFNTNAASTFEMTEDVFTKNKFADTDAKNSLVAAGVVSVVDSNKDEASFMAFTKTLLNSRSFTSDAADIKKAGALGNLKLENDGRYTYTIDDSKVQFLSKGQSLTEEFTAITKDGSQKVFSFKIFGANDKAEILNTAAQTISASDTNLASINGSIQAKDVDSLDSLSVHAGTPTVAYSGGDLPGGLSASSFANALSTVASKVSNGTSVDINWTFSKSHADLAWLKQGDTLTLTYNVAVFDVTADSSNTKKVTITINGTSDAPEIEGTSSSDLAAEFTEGGPAVYVETNSALAVVDADSVNMNSAVAVITNAYEGDSLTIGMDTKGFTVEKGMSLDGKTYTLTVSGSASKAVYTDLLKSIQFTSDSEAPNTTPRDVTFTTYDDTDKPSTAVHHTVNVTAVNDAPALTGTQATLAAGTEDIAYTVSAADLLTGFTDADGDTLSVASLTATNGTVTDNHNGTFTIAPTANYNGNVTLNYNVTDGNSGSTAATETFNLAAVNDAPTLGNVTSGNVADKANAPELGVVLNLFGTLSGDDVDNDNLTYGVVSSSVASYVSDASGRSVTYDLGKIGTYGTLYENSSTGQYLYVADAAKVNKLHSGDVLTDVFTMTVTDGIVSSATEKSFTVNLTGALDNPIATNEKIFVDDTVSSSWITDNSWLTHNDANVDSVSYTVATSFSGSTLTYQLKSGSSVLSTGTDVMATGSTLNGSISGITGTAADNGDHIFSVKNDTSKMIGGSGQDIFVVTNGTGHVIYNLGSGADTLIVSGGAVTNATKLAGNWTVDSLTSHTSGTVAIDANGFNVDLSASSGSLGYTISNTSTASSIVGSSFADIISGGAGNDTISGGAGNDTLTGGAGNDTLTGSTGADTFAFTGSSIASNGTDTITDFISGTDFLKLSAAGTTATTASGNTATFLEYSITQVGNGVALDLSGGDLNGATAGTPTFANTDVISFANLNSSNGNLSTVTSGVELLKMLASTGTASGITVATANNADYLIAYDNSNAYIYHAADVGGTPAKTIASAEIELIGIVQGVAPGGIHAGDVILG